MEKKEDSTCSSAEVDNNNGSKDEFQELLETLEQSDGDSLRLVKYEDFWFLVKFFRPVLSAQKFFKAKENDIILVSFPKSGTTWLKALTFCITNRNIYTIDKSPLLSSHPHTIVPSLEFNIYSDQENPDLQHLPSPRIFSTHIPLRVLPDSIRKSECKIIYICRNPLDQFISHRQFMLASEMENDSLPLGLKESFDMFCEGIHPYGPFWEHMLEYWSAHLENAEKVLFLTYEDLKEDSPFHVKKIAEFLGCPFSPDEEKQGLVEGISSFCSFENLKNLEVNKNGYILGVFKSSSFYRKGEVGDWTNYLSPEMAERMEKVMESKLQGSALKFKIYRKAS